MTTGSLANYVTHKTDIVLSRDMITRSNALHVGDMTCIPHLPPDNKPRLLMLLKGDSELR